MTTTNSARQFSCPMGTDTVKSFHKIRYNWVFPILNCKIGLIQLIRCPKMKKASVKFELTTYWSSVCSCNYCIKEPTVSGRRRKTFKIRFRKLPTIQECQYCQLHFSCAIKTDPDQWSLQPWNVIILYPLLSNCIFTNII